MVGWLLAVGAAVTAVLAVPLMRRAGRPPRDPGPVASAVLGVLPGGNCGACGNESCFDAAAAVASGKAPASICVTGGPQTARAVAHAVRSSRRHDAS